MTISSARVTRATLTALVTIGGWAHAAHAEADRKPTTLVVVDRRTPPESGLKVANPESSLITSFEMADINSAKTSAACDDLPSQPPFLQAAIWHYYECATSKTATLEARARAAFVLAEAAKAAAKQASTRSISEKGDLIAVAIVQDAKLVEATLKSLTPGGEPAARTSVLVQGQKLTVSVKEEKRKSRIESDLETLARVAQAVVLARNADFVAKPPEAIVATSCAAAEKPIFWATSYQYTLRLSRATTTVEQKVAAGPATAVFATAPFDVSNANFTPECAVPEPVPAPLPPTASDDEGRARHISEWRRRVAAEAARLTLEKQRAAAAARANAIAAACATVPPATNGDPLTILVCQLRNTNADLATRAVAAEALGLMGDRSAIPSLELAAGPNMPMDLRSAATRALGRFPSEAAIAAAAAAAPAPAATAPSGDTAPAASVALLTGPAEHFFLSADASLDDTDIKNKDGKITVGKPGIFYVGANYLVGDLLRTKTRHAWDGLFLKVMVKGDKKPLDSWGLGIGFRGEYGKRLGIDLTAISPWAALVSTKRADASEGGDWRLQYGVSLNLDKALEWVKPD